LKLKSKVAPPCGSVCDDCDFFNGEKEPKCAGCIEVQGKPFWGTCELYECTLEKNVEHCGLCEDFPCERLPEQFDPNHPKGKQEAIFRIGQLALRAKLGSEEWLKQRRNGTLVGFE
jgi:hypothetical protein